MSESLGQIILLNGPSSAGKSSIAHELQTCFLPEPLLRFGVDEFMHFLPQPFFAIEPESGPAHDGLKWVLPLEEDERKRVRESLYAEGFEPLAKYDRLKQILQELGFLGAVKERGVQIVCGSAIEETVQCMHRTVADLARAGNNVVVEHAFLEGHWAMDCANTLIGLPVLWVGLRTPLPVLEAREIERGFRVIGQARGHHELIHDGVEYALELDTSLLSPQECAERILAAIPSVSRLDLSTRLR